MDYQRAANVILKRKWLLFFSIAVTVFLTAIMTRLAGTQFVGTVQFVSPTPSSLATTNNSNTPDWVTEGQDFKALEAMYATVVTSKETIEPALQRVHSARKSSDVVKQIEFKASGQRLFELSVSDKTAEQAEQLANALADSFVERIHKLATQRSEKVVSLLQDQLHQADAKLTETRRKADSYSGGHQIYGTPADALRDSMYELEAARRRRDTVQEDLAASHARLSDKEREVAESAPPPKLTRAYSDTQLTLIQEQFIRADNALSELRKRHTDSNPDVKEAIDERDHLQAQLEKAQADQAHAIDYAAKVAGYNTLRKGLDDLKRDIAGLEGQRAVLDANIARLGEQIQKSKQLDSPFGTLASEVLARTETRNALAVRLNNARQALDAAERQNPIVVMERVNAFNPPVNTTSGRTRKLILLAALGALLIVSALILGFNSADHRLKTVEQADSALPARILAAIPQPVGSVTRESMARATELQPQSLHAESYRFLGLHLLNAEEPKVSAIMMLSAKSAQGSTTTLTNLGITLAQAGRRVILVDANMRTPQLHHIFGLPNHYGFTDLLQRPTSQTLDRSLNETSIPNLSVITTGSTALNPWELLRSENLRQVSERLHAIADFVLYDTPSASMFTDALNLAPVVDAAFLCVRAQETPSGAEQRLIELLEQANVRPLGSVLCDVPISLFDGYENYKETYGMSAQAHGSRVVPRHEEATRMLEENELPETAHEDYFPMEEEFGDQAVVDNGHSALVVSAHRIPIIIDTPPTSNGRNGHG